MSDLAEKLTFAAAALRDGRLIVMPTETVYGLAGDAQSDHAMESVYRTKGRPSSNPLIVHVQNVDIAKRYGTLNKAALRLISVFWPGPLTIVVPKNTLSSLSSLVSAGGNTVALRSPNHPVAQGLLSAFGSGIAAPSANRSGRVSPTTTAHVLSEFSPLPEEIAMVLEGGACEIGIESTVVDCTSALPAILRPGSVTKEMIEAALCMNIESGHVQNPAVLKSPGLLESHYAPSLPVRLNAKEVHTNEALLAFGKNTLHAERELNLSDSEDLQEAATHLFAYLRALDVPTFSGIAVMPIPEVGIGVAINDRLKRAAAKKG